MSEAFQKALLNMAFHVPQDTRIVNEVSVDKSTRHCLTGAETGLMKGALYKVWGSPKSGRVGGADSVYSKESSHVTTTSIFSSVNSKPYACECDYF